jgi:hypothetical protein
MINWLCPKPDGPSGGVTFIHHFAHILDCNGHRSQVIQQSPFDLWWDAEPVPGYIIAGSANRDIKENITIIPEVWWHEYSPYWPNPIMLCQNWLWLDKRVPLVPGTKIITVSRHLSNYLQREYENANVIGIVHPYVPKVFRVDLEQKRNTNLVYIQNRRTDLVSEAVRLLNKFNFDTFIGSDTTQVALSKCFNQAEYFLHLVTPEGWPQICAEAMSCGSVVVGTTGGSGNEFMFHKETAMVLQDPVYGFQVTNKDMLYQALSHLNFLRDNPKIKGEIESKAEKWVAQYNVDHTTEELLKVFGAL